MAWQWIAARCRGSSHVASGTRLQDAAVVFTPLARSEVIAVVISDGAGSAEYGGEGASLICRTFGTALRQHFRAAAVLPSDESIHAWLDQARDRLHAVAERRGKQANDFAGTLVGAVSNGGETIVFHVGDGCVVVRDAVTRAWIAPTWPASGEFAATTYFVTDALGARLSVKKHESRVDAIAAFSDGIERLALDFQRQVPAEKFFSGMAAPVIAGRGIGFDRELSSKLREFLESPRVLARTDDDKTLVVAAWR